MQSKSHGGIHIRGICIGHGVLCGEVSFIFVRQLYVCVYLGIISDSQDQLSNLWYIIAIHIHAIPGTPNK